MPTIYFSTPSKLYVNTKFVVSLFDVMGKTHLLGYQSQIMMMTGVSNIAKGRSEMLSQFYQITQNENDILLFLDSDHTFTINDVATALKMSDNTTISCGSYLSAFEHNTYQPLNLSLFTQGLCNKLKYGATGFMLIRKNICKMIVDWMLVNEPETTYVKIDADRQKIIPFFNERIVRNENDDILFPDDKPERMLFLGEDFSFCWLARRAGCTIKAWFSSTLGHEVSHIICDTKHKFTDETQKSLFCPDQIILKGYSTAIRKDIILKEIEIESDKIFNIVYLCGFGRVKFSPLCKDLRGSEQAIIHLCKYWASCGYNVEVYGNVEPDNYDNVMYKTMEQFDYNKTYDNLILWRDAGINLLDKVKAKNILVDMHDTLQSELLNSKNMALINTVMFKSNNHRNCYFNIDDEKCCIIPNGIKIYLFNNKKNIVRNPIRFSFTSDYNRNLVNVLKVLWVNILKVIPEAELHIYTGYDMINENLKKELEELMKQNNIFHHGRVDEKVLVKERYKSTYLLYPCSDYIVETDCITIRECAFAGCIPLCLNIGVFRERPCVKIYGDPEQQSTYQNIFDTIMTLHKDEKLRDSIRAELMASKTVNWLDVGNQWIKYFI